MIHQIRIRNFKSLSDVAVDLSPVTVLVGKSGTGKSNFVESLRFLRNLLASPQEVHALQQKWSELRPATATQAPTRFDVAFSIAGIEEPFEYQLSVDPSGPGHHVLEESLQLGARCLFRQAVFKDDRNRKGPQWAVEPELAVAPAPGPIALGRIPSISEIVIAFTALTSGIGCHAFSDRVLCGGQAKSQSTGLDDKAANYLNALKDIVSNLQDLNVRRSIMEALQRVNPTVSSVELNDLQRPTYVVVGHKVDGKTLPLRLSQESDGFRRFYAHLLALYQRPPKQTLIFEHPEDGIHPGALSLLAEEFKSAPQNSRGQVILTTHSPKLLDHFEVDQIRVVELDGFETRIGLISAEQREAIQDKLLDAGELLTVDPARMEVTTV